MEEGTERTPLANQNTSQKNRARSRKKEEVKIMGDKKYQYSTTHRGKQKVTSQKQHGFLHVKNLPHTHVYKKDGKTIRERWPKKS